MMTPDDVGTQVKNLNMRTSRIEQILPSLATKDDLKALETSIREELKAYATKEDLKVFATKDELREGLEEVRRHTTILIEEVRRHTTILIEAVRDDIRIMAEAVATLVDRRNPDAR